jgi:hypothetical protein
VAKSKIPNGGLGKGDTKEEVLFKARKMQSSERSIAHRSRRRASLARHCPDDTWQRSREQRSEPDGR